MHDGEHTADAMKSDRADALNRQVRAFKQRHRLECEVVPVVLGTLAAAGWIGVSIVVASTGAWPADSVINLLLFAGGTTGALVGTSFLAHRTATLRALARHQASNTCVFCRYDLGAVQMIAGRDRRCPECGELNSRLRTSFSIRHGLRADPP